MNMVWCKSMFHFDFLEQRSFVCFKNTITNLLPQPLITHWTYLLQNLSELWFQRVALSVNYEIVAISTDKNLFLWPWL